MSGTKGPSAARVIALAVVVVLVAAWIAAAMALVTGAASAGRFVAIGLAVAIVGLAVLAVLWAFPTLKGTSESRSPALVRCPRCATTFTPPLRATRSTCPTCGLVAGFDDPSRRG